MANEPYTYSPLLGREIRLLEIEPSLNDDAPLRGSLHTVHLDDQRVVFSALSYLWGDPDFSYNVTIDSCDISITRNASHALRDLRTSLQSKHIQFKYIWIDGLCIDQSNLEERGKQVRLMRDIYSKV
ncbi:heterokaryon incompatibility protein-domain-containing protein [Leptodontidium sp. MPI-SDFR-AT-0119]|nr:heterokaryon incompatibility protein-domain-containing protein [Leptodontidium sp. MPI-SDFR-AT-0119]